MTIRPWNMWLFAGLVLALTVTLSIGAEVLLSQSLSTQALSRVLAVLAVAPFAALFGWLAIRHASAFLCPDNAVSAGFIGAAVILSLMFSIGQIALPSSYQSTITATVERLRTASPQSPLIARLEKYGQGTAAEDTVIWSKYSDIRHERLGIEALDSLVAYRGLPQTKETAAIIDQAVLSGVLKESDRATLVRHAMALPMDIQVQQALASLR